VWVLIVLAFLRGLVFVPVCVCPVVSSGFSLVLWGGVWWICLMVSEVERLSREVEVLKAKVGEVDA